MRGCSQQHASPRSERLRGGAAAESPIGDGAAPRTRGVTNHPRRRGFRTSARASWADERPEASTAIIAAERRVAALTPNGQSRNVT